MHGISAIVDDGYYQVSDLRPRSIRIEAPPPSLRVGDHLAFTLEIILMGYFAPVSVRGEVTRVDSDAVELAFPPPTPNWAKLVQMVLGRDDASLSGHASSRAAMDLGLHA